MKEATRPGGVLSIFGQDSWKATPRLTLNSGLRYDYTFIPPYGTNATIGKQGGIETGDIDFTNGTYILQKVPPSCAPRGFAPCIPGIQIVDGVAVACDPLRKLACPTAPCPHVVVDPRGKIRAQRRNNFGPRFGFAFVR